MVPRLKAYDIYECWTDYDDLGMWFYSHKIKYNIRATADAKQIPERLRKGANRWIVYSAYLSEEDVIVLALTFPQVVVRESNIGVDIQSLIGKVLEEISS